MPNLESVDYCNPFLSVTFGQPTGHESEMLVVGVENVFVFAQIRSLLTPPTSHLPPPSFSYLLMDSNARPPPYHRQLFAATSYICFERHDKAVIQMTFGLPISLFIIV